MFEPSILSWARKQQGMSLDIVAAKLGTAFKNISSSTVASWEKGIEYPTPAQVRKLSEIYRRPTAVFLLGQHPEENPLPPDLRTIWGKQKKEFSPEALLVIRRARRVQEVARELHEELGTPLHFKYRKCELTDDPAPLAKKVRHDLSISVADQFRFRRYSEFFEFLREKIESTGLITLRTSAHNSFSKEDARALSFTDRQPFVILVNNKDTEGAKNFSLLHEFAHVLVREAGICNNFMTFDGRADNFDLLEVFCNRFAASFLVPEKDFLEHRLIVGRKEITTEGLDPLVRSVALSFKVSRFVILRRLLTTGLISLALYKTKAEEWGNENPPRRSGGGKNIPGKAALTSNGISFSSLVFNAYKNEKITASAASDYLGIKPRHLPTFEKELRSHAGR